MAIKSYNSTLKDILRGDISNVLVHKRKTNDKENKIFYAKFDEDFLLYLNKLPNKGKSTLVVTKSAEDNIVRASKNLPKVDTIQYSSLNIVDLMKHQYVLVSKELIKKITEIYS